MKHFYYCAMLIATFFMISCGGNSNSTSKSKSIKNTGIEGKYKLEIMPNVVHEFMKDGSYQTVITDDKVNHCVITTPGTWRKEGDQLIIAVDGSATKVEFGSEATEEQKEGLKSLMEIDEEAGLIEQSYKFIKVDEIGMQLENEGQIIAFHRIE